MDLTLFSGHDRRFLTCPQLTSDCAGENLISSFHKLNIILFRVPGNQTDISHALRDDALTL